MCMVERNNTCKDVHQMKPKCRFKKYHPQIRG